jgi:ankyrin repeat protein
VIPRHLHLHSDHHLDHHPEKDNPLTELLL